MIQKRSLESAVDSSLHDARYFQLLSDVSGRYVGGMYCEPAYCEPDGAIIASGGFMSTVGNTALTYATIANVTGHSVIGLEMPGHGISSNFTKETVQRTSQGDIDWMAEDMVAVIDADSQLADAAAAPRVAFGNSFGAGVVASMAKLYPDKFSRLLLLEPTQLKQRGVAQNLGRYLYEQVVHEDTSNDHLDIDSIELPEIVKYWPLNHDFRKYLLTVMPFSRNSENAHNLRRALEANRQLTLAMQTGSESIVSPPEDVLEFRSSIAQRSAKTAERIDVEIIDGMNHMWGTNPLAVANSVDQLLRVY